MWLLSIHSWAQWPLVVGTLIPVIKLEPCKGLVRAARAGRGTPCKLTFVGMNSEASGRSAQGPLSSGYCLPVAILFKRLSCLPGTEARLQHVAVGGGKLVCCSAIWPVEPIFYSLTLMATQESHYMDRWLPWGPHCCPRNSWSPSDTSQGLSLL